MESGKFLWGKYERLRPPEVEAIRAERSIIYLPWGALEWHCSHDPIGLDSLKAQAICEELAQRTGGVVFPAVYFAASTIKSLKGFAHCVEYSESLLEGLCRETLEQLCEEGFKLIVLIGGHYGQPHWDILKATAEGCNGSAEFGSRVLALKDMELIEDRYPLDHAAIGETSWMRLFDDALVDLEALPQERELTLDGDGIWGEDPRKATVERGAAMLAALLEAAVPLIEKEWERVNK